MSFDAIEYGKAPLPLLTVIVLKMLNGNSAVRFPSIPEYVPVTLILIWLIIESIGKSIEFDLDEFNTILFARVTFLDCIRFLAPQLCHEVSYSGRMFR